MMKNKKRIFLIVSFLTTSLLIQNKIHANVTNWYESQQQKKLKIGRASWYSEQSPGINKHTANNEIFDDTGLTAAMWNVPFNQKVKVTNFKNGRSIIVRINDRGPHRRYVQKGRIIDLSKQAFSKIAPLKEGLIDIQLEFL